MNRVLFTLFTLCAGIAAAQTIPGRYIVEFRTEPAAAISAASRTRFSLSDSRIAARRDQIRSEHALAEQTIRSLRGNVRSRFDAVFNGMAIEMSEQDVAQLRQMPNVAAVYPDMKHQLYLDHAVNVHKIREAWQTIAGGQAGAGAGIKIGIIDSGIDTRHLAFQGFSTAYPEGFPKLSAERERANANNKVIVVRDYIGMTGIDTLGHGTGVAMAAAGLTTDPGVQGFSAFSGAAPGAWLGNYRIIDDQGGTNSGLFLEALQDAITDGMNVVNYSAGGPLLEAGREQGPEARAINNALAAGVLVVVAAGNSGPEPGTLGFPGIVTNAITVGANFNERVLGDAVVLGDLAPFAAQPPSTTQITTQVNGPMVDTTSVDSSGLGCNPFPANSLSGKIALIFRGECAFDDKINNAQMAGAAGVVVYNNIPEGGLLGMTLPTATLASTFVEHASGMAMKQYLSSNPEAMAVLDFSSSTPIPFSSDAIPSFTSGGPTPNGGLKPDISATGFPLLTAFTTQDGDLPYALQAGTSFSAPIVAGAAAVLMAHRPGLTAAQYRSLLVNSAPPLNWSTGGVVDPQIAGSGKLHLLNSLLNTTTATPASINFQATEGTYDLTRTLEVSNIGEADAFTLTVKPVNMEGAVPEVSVPSFTLDRGATQAIQVRIAAADPAAGEYTGFLEISGTKTGVVTRVPYWLGVRGTSARYISLQRPVDRTSHATGASVSIMFRSLDITGMPIAAGAPTVTSSNGRAVVESIDPVGTIPGTYEARVTIGRASADGTNIFTIAVGDATRDITFFVRN